MHRGCEADAVGTVGVRPVDRPAGAAEDPANSKLLKQCESAKGQVKRECEEVAKRCSPEEPKERDDQTSQEVTPPSPAMATPAEGKGSVRGEEEAAEEAEAAFELGSRGGDDEARAASRWGFE